MGPLNNMTIACRHCEDPSCVAACPRDALTQEEGTGLIIIDEKACDGCSWCISACQFGSMMMHPDKKVVFTCDNCQDREDGPQWVKWCPEEALSFVTAPTLAQKSRMSAVKNLFQGIKENKKTAR